MSTPDLAKDEAIAEVQAFMGEGWTVIAVEPDGSEEPGEEFYVSTWRRGPCSITANAFRPTFRECVDSIKQQLGELCRVKR